MLVGRGWIGNVGYEVGHVGEVVCDMLAEWRLTYL